MKWNRTWRRILTATLALGLLAAVCVMPAGAEEAVNMLKNGDFSRRTNYWQTWTQDAALGTFTAEKDGGPDGSDCLKITNEGAIGSSLFQFVNCKQGSKYMLVCDVKCENVGTEGSGFCLGYTTYDASGNNIGEWLGTSSFGTSDWRTVSFVFEITNEPTSVNVGPRLWFSTGTVYVDNVSLIEMKDTPAVSSTYALTLAESANRHTVNALGCEWDPKMLLPVNEAHGITEDDLTFIKERMEALNLQAVRMMITPDWFEAVNDNDDPHVADPAGFDFDNPEMKSVFAYLKVCQELGVRVTLTWWGAPTGCWLACENIGDWIGAPNDLDEMAENIAYLLGYIRGELKYDCVKELILQNEPSYSFKVSGGAVDFDYYVDYYKTVRQRLNDDGMEDIVLVGSDDSQHYGWYYNSYEALKDVCGKFNSHNYAWSYDLPYLDVLAQEFVEARTALSGDTPFYLGEFGDGSTQGAYVADSADTYGRGIYVASVVVNAFKAGAAGASYWPLHDIYYYDGDPNGGDNGGLMSMGLIGFKQDGAWSFRPTYYAYGLLCRYIPYGASVYDIEGDTDHLVDAVAAKTTDGRWSLVLVNRSEAEQTVTVGVGEAVTGRLNRYAYTESTLPTDGSMIAASGTVSPSDGQYTVTVPASGFLVLSNIGMTDEEMAGTPGESTTDIIDGTDIVDDPAITNPKTDDTEASTGGCRSTLSVGAGVAVTAAAVLLGRKKRVRRGRRT